MLKFVPLVLIALVACASQSMDSLVEGGLYSTPNDDGTFSVIKVLKLDDQGVHVRVYSNRFREQPSSVDEGSLYMVGMKRNANEGLGLGHLPLSRSSFAGWHARFIKRVEVKPEELEGYKEWLDAKGGYF
jgi:hypothetical protein